MRHGARARRLRPADGWSQGARLGSSGSIPLVTVYLARRLVIFAISLFVASVLVFVALSVLPGDPAQAMLGTQATPEALHQLRHQLGLDRPL